MINRIRFERTSFGGGNWIDHSTQLKFRWFSPTASNLPTRIVYMRGQPTDPNEPVEGGNPEQPTAPYHFWNGFQYRLKPNTENNLAPLCEMYAGAGTGAVSAPQVDPVDEILICVGNKCSTDFNADNTVNGADLSVLLGSFGTTIPFGGPQTADANGDNLVNGADLSALLGTFQDFCPPCNEAAQGLQGGGEGQRMIDATEPVLPLLVAQLGFETIPQYVEYVESLSPEELAVHRLIIQTIVNGD